MCWPDQFRGEAIGLFPQVNKSPRYCHDKLRLELSIEIRERT